LIQEKASRTPIQRKISSDLLYAKSDRFAATLAPSKQPEQQITSLQQRDAKGRVLVDIAVRGDMSGATSAIAASGGELVVAGQRSARAWIALDQLENVAAASNVVSVRAAMQWMTARINPPHFDAKFQTGTRTQRVAAMQAATRAFSQRTAAES